MIKLCPSGPSCFGSMVFRGIRGLESFRGGALETRNFQEAANLSVGDIKIIYGDIRHIDSFHETLSFVAQEKIYIEMIEAPPVEKVREFQDDLISKSGPVYYAMKGGLVVGWCDVFPEDNPRQSHRGGLGMGLLPAYRGKGIGSKLLEKVIVKAKEFGLEKIELHVYTTNESAIALYKKFGFEEEGIIKRYRKLNGEYFDCLAMAKFL